MTAEIIKKRTLSDIVNLRQVVETKLKEMNRIYGELKSIENEVCNSMFLNAAQRRNFEFDDDLKNNVDEFFWNYLIELSDMTSVMTEAGKEVFLEKIRKKPPEFNDAEVKGFSQNIETMYLSTIETTIHEVYRLLIGCNYSSDWRQGKKTNNLRGIEKQFRCRGDIERGFSSTFKHDHWNTRCQRIRYEDLYRVCKLLNGDSKFDYADSFRVYANRDLVELKKDTVETPFFDVKCYLNGNQKVTLKRMDILSLFNQIGSGLVTLPDVMKKKRNAR